MLFRSLHVHGESMIEDGILDGDIIVVEQNPNPSRGDIVVALIDDEATVKRFFRHDGNVELRPENPQMESIFVNEVAVLGRVRGVIRAL